MQSNLSQRNRRSARLSSHADLISQKIPRASTLGGGLTERRRTSLSEPLSDGFGKWPLECAGNKLLYDRVVACLELVRRTLQKHAPFVQKTKSEIVQIGARLNVPFAETWSCYEGLEIHCGRCGTCVERKEAFELAGVFDPTEYSG